MQPGDVIGDRYQVERVAGSGATGTVYRARDVQSGATVAVKVVFLNRPEVVERFAKETKVLAALDHPGIVRLLGSGVTREQEPYIVMEWLEGHDLAARLERAPLSIAESVALATRIAEGLAAAHARGVVHRDVKPSNVFLVGGDVARVKLLDFGIARMTGVSGAPTRTGVLLGTPGYMAPEQARGARDVGPRADVFSLGCVLFECLAGRPPFLGDHAMALLAKILLEDAPRVTDVAGDVSNELADLVARMLAKDPEMRPADGAAAARELVTAGALRDATAAATPKRSPSLTAGEMRLLSVVLLVGDASLVELSQQTGLRGRSIPPPDDDADEPEPITPRSGALEHLVASYGGRFDRLGDGTALITLAGSGAATDQASRAARCALALRAATQGGTVAVATGRGMVKGPLPFGAVVDRAQGLVHALVAADDDDDDPEASAKKIAAASTKIRVDDVTAGLLEGRFELTRDDFGYALRAERDLAGGGARLLLGRSTPCVGRELELNILREAFRQTQMDGSAHVVLVTAPPGGGKTRLRQELLRGIERAGDPVTVWIAEGDPSSAGSPFSLVAAALRRALALGEGKAHERRERLREAVAARAPRKDSARIAAFLGELLDLDFPDDESVELLSARQDRVLFGDQLRRAFEDFVACVCADKPLLIVLEDLQWGDLASVHLVEAALRRLVDQPLFVLALARPEVHRIFPRLWEERALQEIRLPELGKKSAERLVRSALADRADDEVVRGIVAQGNGNPFFLEELVRASAGGSASSSAPVTVLAMVEARLGALDSESRRVLRAASVFGQELWPSAVGALLGGMSANDLKAWIAELVKSEIIAPQSTSRFPGEPAFVFRQPLFREAAYATLTDADRELGHRLAAAWLLARGEEDSSAIAAHFERGGEPDRAVTFHIRAAEHAMRGCDLDEVATRVERAIDCGAEGETLGVALAMRAEAHAWRSEYAEAKGSAHEAIEVLARGGAEWSAANATLALALSKLGEDAEVTRVVDALEAQPIADPHRASLISALADASTPLLLAGHRLRAERLLVRIGEAADDLAETEPLMAARLASARAAFARMTGEPGVWLEQSRLAAEAFARAGDLRRAHLGRARTGHALLELGAYEQAATLLRSTMDESRALGLRASELEARLHLGVALSLLGRVDEGAAMELEVARAAADAKDARAESSARRSLAIAHALKNDLLAADAEARRAADVAKALPTARAPALAVLARIALARGDARTARAAATEAAGVYDRTRVLDGGESVVRLAFAEALRASGDEVRGREAMRAARERVLERAAGISDAALRMSYLEKVAENAWTLALAASWIGP